MAKIKRRCGKKKMWKSEEVVAGQLAPITSNLCPPLTHVPKMLIPLAASKKSEKQLPLFFFPK
jgi:hypothetical protein